MSEYDPEVHPVAAYYCFWKGYSAEQTARVMRIDIDTLQTWLLDHPEMIESYQRAKSLNSRLIEQLEEHPRER